MATEPKSWFFFLLRAVKMGLDFSYPNTLAYSNSFLISSLLFSVHGGVHIIMCLSFKILWKMVQDFWKILILFNFFKSVTFNSRLQLCLNNFVMKIRGRKCFRTPEKTCMQMLGKRKGVIWSNFCSNFCSVSFYFGPSKHAGCHSLPWLLEPPVTDVSVRIASNSSSGAILQ